MKPKRNYIVQFKCFDRWIRSMNYGAEGRYTKAGATRRAKEQKMSMGCPYRAKEIK